MKTVVRYGILVLVLYVIFLLVLLPADRVYAVLKERISLPVSLYQVDGSVWDGSAAVAMVGTQRFDSIDWRFRPLALFLGRFEVALDANRNGRGLSAVAGRSVTGDYFLRDLNADLPAAELESLYTRVKLGLSGDVIADIGRIVVEKSHLATIEGKILWNDAGLTMSPGNPLGSFEIDFETTDEGVKGLVKDTGGALQVDGVLMLKPDGSYQFTGAFKPRDTGRNDIRQALRIFGNPDASGKVTVSQSGNIQLEKYIPFIKQS
jgi:general secretion pathway protein N